MKNKNSGTITRLHYPLVTVKGMSGIGPGELVRFGNGTTGMILHCSTAEAEVMALGKIPLSSGETVSPTGKNIQFPADDSLLGKVISPLGEVLLGEQVGQSGAERLIDTAPPNLTHRAPITEFLYTGISLVDSFLPLALGQRELVAGDRKTSKSGFLLQAMLAQVQRGSKVVYCLIGKRREEIKYLANIVAEHEIQDSVVIVASSALDPASQIILTPFTAMMVAEYFRDQGEDVLVIFDDLTTHARYYREVALLGRSFPGRDSYPGDIFYVHARLLERAGNFTISTKKKEYAAITALPVAETVESELTDYIVSNLISITDGHLLFDTQLLQRGQHPPINLSLSVTRVGKQTTSPLQREMNQKLSIFLNQYEKTLRLTHFGSELSDEAKSTLKRGSLLMEFLDQDALEIVPLAVQSVIPALIYGGFWDEREVKDIGHYRKKMSDRYRQEPEIHEAIDHIALSADFGTLQEKLKKNAKALTLLCQS